MVKETLFDEKIYDKCKKELNSRNARKIIMAYIKQCKIDKGYPPEFLSYYYSPILIILRQFLGDLKNKHILEIGYRMPMFLDYLISQGSKVHGIDIEPYIIKDNLLKMSIEKIDPRFLIKYENKFHAIVERITLSRLYDEKYFLETGKHRFNNKDKILSNLFRLLKPNGILVLQDDRGTIFSESQFAKIGFNKVMKEKPIFFKDKNGKDLGWNVLVVYQKPAR